MPFSLYLTGERSAEVSLPVELHWNIDQHMKQIQVIAWFTNSRCALADAYGHKIPASDLEASFGKSVWKTFPESRLTVEDSGILLTTLDVSAFQLQSRLNVLVQVRTRELGLDLPPGRYDGQLELRRYFVNRY